MLPNRALQLTSGVGRRATPASLSRLQLNAGTLGRQGLSTERGGRSQRDPSSPPPEQIWCWSHVPHRRAVPVLDLLFRAGTQTETLSRRIDLAKLKTAYVSPPATTLWRPGTVVPTFAIPTWTTMAADADCSAPSRLACQAKTVSLTF